jgi:hypothetical protein
LQDPDSIGPNIVHVSRGETSIIALPNNDLVRNLSRRSSPSSIIEAVAKLSIENLEPSKHRLRNGGETQREDARDFVLQFLAAAYNCVSSWNCTRWRSLVANKIRIDKMLLEQIPFATINVSGARPGFSFVTMKVIPASPE